MPLVRTLLDEEGDDHRAELDSIVTSCHVPRPRWTSSPTSVLESRPTLRKEA